MERATREVWAKRVERWQDSGLTAKEFAAELEVSPNSLTFWKWKLRQLASDKAPAPRTSRKSKVDRHDDVSASFVQLVSTSSPQVQACQFEVVLGSGAVVRVPQDFDEPTLLRLVHVLGGR
jgi:transposase